MTLLHILSTCSIIYVKTYLEIMWYVQDAHTANQLNKVPMAQASSHTRAILKSCMKRKLLNTQKWYLTNNSTNQSFKKGIVNKLELSKIYPWTSGHCNIVQCLLNRNSHSILCLIRGVVSSTNCLWILHAPC